MKVHDSAANLIISESKLANNKNFEFHTTVVKMGRKENTQTIFF